MAIPIPDGQYDVRPWRRIDALIFVDSSHQLISFDALVIIGVKYASESADEEQLAVTQSSTFVLKGMQIYQWKTACDESSVHSHRVMFSL